MISPRIVDSENKEMGLNAPEKGLYLIGVGQEQLIDGRYTLTYLVDGSVAKDLLCNHYLGVKLVRLKGDLPFLISFLVNKRGTVMRDAANDRLMIPQYGIAVHALHKKLKEQTDKQQNKLSEWISVEQITDKELVLRDSRHSGKLTFKCFMDVKPETILSEIKHAIKYGDLTLRLKAQSIITVNQGIDFVGNVQLNMCTLVDPFIENSVLDRVHGGCEEMTFRLCEVSDWQIPPICENVHLSYGIYEGKNIPRSERVQLMMGRTL